MLPAFSRKCHEHTSTAEIHLWRWTRNIRLCYLSRMRVRQSDGTSISSEWAACVDNKQWNCHVFCYKFNRQQITLSMAETLLKGDDDNANLVECLFTEWQFATLSLIYNEFRLIICQRQAIKASETYFGSIVDYIHRGEIRF